MEIVVVVVVVVVVAVIIVIFLGDWPWKTRLFEEIVQGSLRQDPTA